METLRLHYRSICRFARDERAATSIEYALLAAGIAVAIIATVNALGATVSAMFASVS